MDKVIEDRTALIAKAKTITIHVIVSSVLPRNDRDVSERSLQMNNAIITICDETNSTFVSHDKNFLYQDGSADTSVFYKDGVHPNDRLLENLSLTVSKRKSNTRHNHFTFLYCPEDNMAIDCADAESCNGYREWLYLECDPPEHTNGC